MTRYILAGLWNHYTNPHLVCQKLYLCSNEYQKRDLSKDIEKIMEGKKAKDWERPRGRK